MFESNYDLCYVNTIAWTDILTGQNALTRYTLNDRSQSARECKYIVFAACFHTELVQIANIVIFYMFNVLYTQQSIRWHIMDRRKELGGLEICR